MTQKCEHCGTDLAYALDLLKNSGVTASSICPLCDKDYAHDHGEVAKIGIPFAMAIQNVYSLHSLAAILGHMVDAELAAARDREKAAIAAARQTALRCSKCKTVLVQHVIEGDFIKQWWCSKCRQVKCLGTGEITPDQSAARGGASQNESKSFDGTLRLPTGEGQ